MMESGFRRVSHFSLCCLGTTTLVAALMSGSTKAQDEFSLDGEDYLSELPVVLTVTRLPQSKAELPMAVTVIDREMIEASGAVELSDLFRMVAGFQVGHYHDTDGSRVAVTYHGNTDQYSRRMQVLIDGRSVYTWGTGGAEWTDLPVAIDDIERIEVSRGPNGVANGSNAFLGVINIITRHTAGLQGSHVRLTVDEDQYREALLSHSAATGDVTYRITGSYKADNGFDDYTSPNGNFYQLNDDTQTAALTFRGDYRAGVNDYWTAQIGGAAGPREAGFDGDVIDPTRERDVRTFYQQLQWKHVIDSESEINAQIYHNLHKVEDKFKTAALSEIYTYLYEDACIPVATVPECALYPFDANDLLLLVGVTDQTLPRNTTLQSERYDLEVSHRLRLSDSLRLVWGGELRLDEVTAADYFDTGDSYQHHLSRLFFNGEWKPTASWVVNLGDMVEQSDMVGTLHSPRLAVNRLLGSRGYIRLSASRAYRIPTAVEEKSHFTMRYADGTLFHTLYDAAGGIDPERIESTELAFGAEGKNAGYEVKLFREDISDEIGSARNDLYPQPHWTMAKVGERTVNGAELQLKARTEESLISLAYSYSRVSGHRVNVINFGGVPGVEKVIDVDDSVPRYTLNALISQRLGNKLWAGINYYSVSPMEYYSGDLTNGIQSLDATISKKFSLSDKAAEIKMGLTNLLGTYYDFEEETISQRQVFLTMKMDF